MKGYTKVIDDEFVAIVLSNQMDFNGEGYRFKKFTFSYRDNYPEEELLTLTINVHKYVNKVARQRVERYKLAMSKIQPFSERENVLGTKYFNLLDSACREFYEMGYSHEGLMAFCADMCTYTRCGFMKGLRSTYWARYLLAEVLLLFRRNHASFSDGMYSKLDKWLLKKVPEIEDYSGPIDLNPIEISLEWTNFTPPAPSSSIAPSPDSPSNATGSASRSYEDDSDESLNDNFAISESATSGAPEISGCMSRISEHISESSENSEDIEKKPKCQKTMKHLRI